MVFLAATGVVPLLQAALLACVVVVLSGVLRANEAREAVDLDVIVVVACSLAIGTAVQSSGLADSAAHLAVLAATHFGVRAALVSVTLVTVVLAQFLTCNAAAAVAIPLAIATSARLGVDPRGMIMAATIAASSSYLTPLGYQTKMMVYGPGGYRFTDYARLGLPLTVAVVVTIAIAAPLIWPF
jgi:di/tricarboxylate transporter